MNLEKFKNASFKTDDGEEVKVIDLMSAILVEAGAVKGADGSIKFPAMNVETRSQVDEAKSRATESYTFIKSVMDGKVEAKAVPSSGDSSYGAVMPTGLYEQIMLKRDALAEIRKYATVIPVAGKVQLGAEATQATTYWVGENTQITESQSALAKVSLEDWYLACRSRIPFKVLEGSPLAVEAYFANLMGRAIAKEEDAQFISGDDSSKPKGIRTTATNAGAQAGANLTYAEVVTIFYSVKAPYRKNAVWVTASKGVKAMMAILDGAGRPIFDPATGTVFGRPLIETENIPENLGGGTDRTEILFGDLSYYAIKDGAGMQLLNRGLDDYLQVQLVAYEAVDGELTLAEAVCKFTAVK